MSPDPTTPRDEAVGLRAAAGLFAGFALLAVVNAGAVALEVPLPRAGAGLRAAHHLFDAAETLGLGALAAAAIGVFSGLVRLPGWAAVIVYAAATTPLVLFGLADDLYRQASAYETFETPVLVLYVLLAGFAVPAAHVIGAWLSRRPRLRFLALDVALSVLCANHVFLRDDYFGLHCSVAIVAAVFAGAALGPLAERAALALARSRPGRGAIAAIAALCLLGLAVPPGNAVRVELFRQPAAVAPWVLAAVLWRPPSLHAPVVVPPSPWLRERAADPPVPPTTPPLLPAGPVVVVVTIDAVRADVVNGPANDAILPTLVEIKRRGVVFPHASAPGSQTAVSLGTMFSGRYFSELYWSWHGTGLTRYEYAADDPSPRFPALLSARGVGTVNEASLAFLAGEFGVVRGFREEKMRARGTNHARAREVIDPLLRRLEHASPGPLFAFVHLTEPHAPYDRGRRDGTEYEKYVSEVAVADAALGKVLRLLDERFADRWLLFVASDHGEAFGDHQTFQHGKTLYEELVHVPLLAVGPRLAPRTVETRVGLVDLGPTILDLFGVETPATFEGQSLVPMLAGGPAAPTRPLIAEARLEQSLTTPEGLKVIEDLRRKTVQVYDLAADPGETQNLFDLDPARADPPLAALRAFFAVHTLQRPGYRAPYKP